MGDLQEPRVALIKDKRWEKAEKATHKIITEFAPTAVSEERRRMVIDYVQGLIKGYIGCEMFFPFKVPYMQAISIKPFLIACLKRWADHGVAVIHRIPANSVFPYGSVPLNTYLPDGDIDLTAVGFANFEESVVNGIVSVLEREEKNRSSEFIVKDVQLIRAEVKLVKCLVQNILVDISFNQIGGLCTLCFLEQVDRLIGKNHLFKRSIILIKAWCYYESRILGAFHGLISTYALETLVLYVFNVFHTELDGPLAVLYKFLHYFSTFDWDNYCISLNGPILISALPDIVVKTSANCPGLLLGSDFLRFCSDMFSVPSKGSGSFTPKHLNIVDPLKENNNLGRSVSRGNCIRIRSAFAYGAKKLGSILMEAGLNNIADEIRSFFSNTLVRHGSEKHSDIEDCIPRYTLSAQTLAFSNAETERGLEIPFSRIESGQPRNSVELVNVNRLENGNLSEGNGLAGNRFSGDAKDHTSFRFQDLRVSDDPSKFFSRSSGEESSSSPVALPYASHFYFSKSKSSNMKMKNENLDMIHLENSIDVCNEVVASSSPAEDSHSISQNFDLAGDYESHLDSLQHARRCYEFVFSVPSMTAPPPLPPLPTDFHSMGFRDPVQDSSHLKRNGISHGNVNGVICNPMFNSMNPRVIPVMNFGLEDAPRQRGTGTYFPNMNRPPHGYRPSGARGRYNGYTRSSPHSNGEVNSAEKSNLKPSSSQFFVDRDGGTQPLEFMHLSNSPRKLNPNANGFLPLPVVTEYGHGAQTVPSNDPSLPKGRQSTPATESLPPVEIPRPNPVLGMDRFMVPSSYHLKDEDDFPPLSV